MMNLRWRGEFPAAVSPDRAVNIRLEVAKGNRTLGSSWSVVRGR
jgi:hypothetical protein